jgi:hypothetical protein
MKSIKEVMKKVIPNNRFCPHSHEKYVKTNFLYFPISQSVEMADYATGPSCEAHLTKHNFSLSVDVLASVGCV